MQPYRSMNTYQYYNSDPISLEDYKTPIRNSSVARVEPSPRLWLDKFWKTVHVMAACYSPKISKTRDSYRCFYQSMANILPTAEARAIMAEFLHMSKSVQQILLADKILSSFFTVYGESVNYSSIYKRMSQGDFFISSFQNEDTLFAWTFLFHGYYNIRTGIPVENLNSLKTTYDKKTVSKDTWGNPLWGMIHFIAYYAPAIPDPTWKISFKAFISCLMTALPCGLCRANLEVNLSEIEIDPYMKSRETIFEYTYKLHEMVNKETKKAPITLAEAKRIYDPYSQPQMRHNVYEK